MVVHGTNEQKQPEGDGYANPLGGGQTKDSSKKNSGQTKESKSGLQEGKHSSTRPSKGLPTCSEYELTLAWMWDTQDVTCPPHRR